MDMASLKLVQLYRFALGKQKGTYYLRYVIQQGTDIFNVYEDMLSCRSGMKAQESVYGHADSYIN